MSAPKNPRKKIPHPLYRLALPFRRKITGETAQRVAEGLEDLAVSVFLHNKESTDGDNWTVTLTTLGPPDMAEVKRRLDRLAQEEHIRGLPKKLKAAKLPERNWLRHVHDNFPPVTVGSFFIRGSHYKGKTPKGLTPLNIDAATAFGSGEHQTTKGCLLAFEKLAEKHSFKNALDMGCGSGILAIAMKKVWPRIKLTAIDIDPESVRVTKRHAGMNKVKLQAAAGDGFRTPLSRGNGPYDLIAANILAGPLIDMAPACRAALAPGGFCVLSGLLKRQAAEVTKAYEKQGLKPIRRLTVGAWMALVFQRDM
jgi:ribosomal protein L11 methyltransferase